MNSKFVTIVLFAFVCSGHFNHSNAETIFINETFADGDHLDDDPLTWTPQGNTIASVVDGDLVLERQGSTALLSTGLALENVSIRTQGFVEEGDVFVGLGVRRDRANQPQTGYFGYFSTTGEVGIGISGKVEGLKSVETDLDLIDSEFMMQMDVIEDVISFWVWEPGQPIPDQPIVQTETVEGPPQVGDVSPWVDSMCFCEPVEATFRFVQISNEHITDPVLGDFNRNGVVDTEDIDLLNQEIRNGLNSAEFDLTNDELVNLDDQIAWVKKPEIANTYYGDANLDGEFNSSDLVTVFQIGKYELDVSAGWVDGDWNGDQRFDSGDLVKAFQDGGYELGPRKVVNAVPEPTPMLFLVSYMIACSIRRRAFKKI